MPDIVKADGTVEPWDGRKLEYSLVCAGASEMTAARIRETIESSIGPAEKSNEIYRRAFAMLRGEARTAAARYSLRRAFFELGPTGHPFEDFVSEMLKTEGWDVQPRQLIPGKCVSHEVDVYAVKDGQYLAGELKYHNDPGYKTDIKVALYVKARMDDILQCDPTIRSTCPVDQGYLITNTKFTSQAVDYATCAGLNLLGWSYPHGNSLYDRIVRSGLYPVTALTQLRKSEKRLLIDKGIVTTSLVREHRDKLRELAIPLERIGSIVAEIETLSAEAR
jgi:hypothetical protein